MIHFNIPPFVGTEFKYMHEAVENHKICGDGPFTKRCNEWIENRFNANRVMLTTSGSTALDMAALLCGIQPGDEVICQSFTFAASANPIAYLEATPVFVDSEKDTWNMDPVLLEMAIKDRLAKTGRLPKAIIPVHLYGMPVKMGEVMEVANRYGIPVLEDSAEALGS